jgi:hypothetical protein
MGFTVLLAAWLPAATRLELKTSSLDCRISLRKEALTMVSSCLRSLQAS